MVCLQKDRNDTDRCKCGNKKERNEDLCADCLDANLKKRAKEVQAETKKLLRELDRAERYQRKHPSKHRFAEKV